MAERRLGPLERRVMDALWARDTDARVRDLQPEFPDIAYTTLMTTLDRLRRKGLLDRVAVGRAFAYRARVSHGQLHTETAVGALRGLVAGGGDLRPLLSYFVEEVSNHDETALDALERLIRKRRRALDRGTI